MTDCKFHLRVLLESQLHLPNIFQNDYLCQQFSKCRYFLFCILPVGVSGNVQVVMCVGLCLKNVFTSFKLLILEKFNRWVQKFSLISWFFSLLFSVGAYTLKISTFKLLLTFILTLQIMCNELSKCEIDFRQYGAVSSKMGFRYPFEKNWLWGNYGTCLVFPIMIFITKDISINPYACVNLFFNEYDPI